MNYGLYLSASGVQVNMYRQDVFANNLANLKTPGFKRDLAAVSQRPPESVENSLGFEDSHELLDRIGGGVLAAKSRISFEQGSMIRTGGPLHVALNDPRTFFLIDTAEPGTGESNLRLTRDGQFNLNDSGYLVTMTGGHRVLDEDNREISVPEGGHVELGSAGQVRVNGEVVARLKVASVTDLDALRKQPNNLLKVDGPLTMIKNAMDRSMRPGYIEASSVDPMKGLLDMISATKAINANGNLIRYHDQMLDRVINTFGRVG